MSEHDPDASPHEPRPGLFDGPPVDTRALPEPPVVVARRRGGTPLAVILLLTAALAGAGYYAWSHPMAAPPAAQDAQLGQQVQAVSTRVDALEKRVPEAGEAAAEQARKLDELSARVAALAGKQDQMSAEASKAVEIAGQKTPSVAAAPPPPDRTSQEVPGLIAQQNASDAKEVGHAPGQPPAAPGTALAGEAPAPAPAADQKALDALDQRVAKLEQSAPPAPAGAAAPADAAAVAALGERLARLEQASGQTQAAQQADPAALAALSDRLGKLEQSSGQAQSAAETAQKGQQGDTAALAALTERLGRLEQTAGQAQSQDAAALKEQASAAATLESLDARIGKLEQGAGQAQGALSGATRDATRAIRVEAAAAALQAGQPLGEIPGAPPALGRYATAAPPTEAALRADFPRVAEAASAASQPDTAHRSFLQRAFARLQQSVVVRQGDHVVVGDPAAGVLARAQDSVSAGDLKGAADTLGSLTGPAADAVRPWVAQTRALLDARAALATLAAHN